MASKMSSIALIGAGAYGGYLAFSVTGSSSPRAARTTPKQGLRGAAPGAAPNSGQASGAACSAACAAGVLIAGTGHGKRSKKRGVQVRAVADEELEYQVGERVMILGPPAMAGKQGTVEGHALGNAFMVRFDSGSIFNISSENLCSTSGSPTATSYAAPAATASYAAPVPAAPVPSGDDEELEFQPGQRVVMLGPPALAGKQGTIMGAALGGAFSVQFDSGSVFNIATANMQDANGPSPSAVPVAVAPAAATSYSAPAAVAAPTTSGGEEELLFQPGERVTLVGPPAMAGKQGTVVGPALGDAFSIRFDSGSVFNMATANIQGSGAPAPAAAAPAAATSYSAPAAVTAPTTSGDEEELLFQPGERVTIVGPPAMAGKQGAVVGPALGNAFAIRFDSGSVFNIEIHNIQGSGVAAPAAAAPATATYSAPAAVAAPSASGDDKELLFQPGERVTIVGPPAMAGKQGTVVAPALDDAFSIRFDSGSVFNIALHNIQGSGVSAPAAAAPATATYSAPAAVAAPSASGDDEELFQPGERITLVGPPAMAGKQGSIVGPAIGNAFSVLFDSGSVFNIEVHNIQGSGVPPPAPVAAPVAATASYAAPAAAAPAGSGDDEELYQPGQKVEITGPPAMAGKKGEIVESALGDAFSVRFETGSVFNIAASNIRVLAMSMA